MWPEQQSPLVLTAMTLRGIGSYFTGSRLEIRPLTVLCGKNGSGKSTWLKVLNVLSDSLRAGKLPFGFEITDWESNNIQLTNAFYHLAYPDDHARAADPEAALKYGPPGAIGLEFRAVRDIQLPNLEPSESPCAGKPQEFLWRGKCPAGTSFRIRLAHPSYWADDAATPELFHLVELELDGRYTISMQGERDPLQKFETGYSRPRRSRPYDLSCTAAFLPGADQDAIEVVKLATVRDLVHTRCEPAGEDVSAGLAASVLSAFDQRLRKLLEGVLEGYFYIGAVRQPQTYLSLSDHVRGGMGRVVEERRVGPAGEYAWFLERHFAFGRMRPATLGPFKAEDIAADNCLSLFSGESRLENRKLARIWEFAAPEHRSRVDDLRAKPADESLAAECIAEFLNSLLDRRDLFSDDCWLVQEECFDDEGESVWVAYSNDPEIERYRNKGTAGLPREELARLNRLLIEEALCECDSKKTGLRRRSEYYFEEYVSQWMQMLTEAGINHYYFCASNEPPIGQWYFILPQRTRRNYFGGDSDSVRIADTGWIDRPAGFLLQPESYSCDLKEDDLLTQRVTHPCFGEGPLGIGVVQPPRQLSSGFHQVFPIVVQLGLMRQGDVVGTENPEVHLHPSLQLQLTAALVAHAITGRRIILETQSDLVIRRVIRAVLEEDLPQADVRIYFTNLTESVQSEKGNFRAKFRYSTLCPISIDDRGRISNWPDGFLDEDVRESQRLLDIMYGGPDSGDDDG